MEKKSALVFENYRKKYIGKFLTEELPLLLEKHKDEVDTFRGEWCLENRKIKTEKEYRDWIDEIEVKLKEKQTDISYFEEEEGHTLKGYKTVAIELFTLMEDSPRILPQGNSLESVFDYRLRQIMRKIGIDPDWYGIFKNYILSGEIDLNLITHPNIDVSERFLFGPENDEIDHRISLNIGPNTRLEDIENAWPFVVVPLQKKMKALRKGKNRHKPTKKIALEILRLHNKGKTISQIIKIIDPKDLEWDEFKTRKALSRAKKWVQK